MTKEISDIIRAHQVAKQAGRETALATVVHVEGSSYRRPGARMLIEDNGQLTGAISGGCLEGDALKKALLVMHKKEARLVTYDTMDADDAKLGLGLGCNGIIQVLIEPVDVSDPHNPVRYLQSITENRQKSVAVTLFSLRDKKEKQMGTCLLLKEDGSLQTHAPVLQQVLLQEAENAMTKMHSCVKHFITPDAEVTAFIEAIRPPVSLIVFGAGNDVVPLVSMAQILGWEATVIDGRPEYAKQDRVTGACQVLVSIAGTTLENLAIDEQTVILLMTHNYNYDLAILRRFLPGQVPYLGMLGPRKKREMMLDELRNEGMQLTEARLACLHSPVGLDIGADTPEEIALAISAEIKAFFAGRTASPLKHSHEVIHSRSVSGIEKRVVDTTTQ